MIWFATPAARWLDGLPVGNGRVGGMWYGDADLATIALNDETFFSAGPRHRDLTGAHEALVRVRELLRAGDPRGAQAAATALLGTPPEMAAYQPLAALRVRAPLSGDRTGFRRSLDTGSGVARLADRRAGGEIRQELVAAREPSVLLLRTETSTVDWSLEAIGGFVETTEMVDSTTMLVRGRWREGVAPNRRLVAGSYRLRDPQAGAALRFAVMVRVVEGDCLGVGESGMRVGAGASVLAITTATDLNGSDVNGADPDGAGPIDRCLRELDAVGDPARAFARAVDTHRAVMDRAAVEIDDPFAQALRTIPTDRRVAALRAGGADDSLLIELADFGRYLLVASSLGGTLPPNLQGIWNEDVEPAWSARWTLNINLQMNLWAAGPWNLPEAAIQLADFVASLADSGAITARRIYDSDGWVVHHNTDVWRATEPTTMVEVGLFPAATAWLCDQLWDLYLFGSDPALLARIAPLLAGAASFVAGWLVPDEAGRLVSSPSSTPENAYLLEGVERPVDIAADLDYGRHAWLCESPTLDVWLIRALLDDCLRVADLLPALGIETAGLRAVRMRLRPLPIRDGVIDEWTTAERPREIGHRHLSSLYGIYPGRADLRAEPELAAAAAATLLRHQSHVESSANGWGGWSRVWAGCLWARLGDGDRAHDSVLHWMRTTVSPSSLLCTFPEFDGRPGPDAIFQIDANLGLPAVVAEMLVQSHTGSVRILPALPARWRSGRFRGLRAHGGHLIDAEWSDGRLTSLTVHPAADGVLVLELPAGAGGERTVTVQAGVPLRLAFPNL